jgi:salicylate hydroxylase
VAAYRLIIEVPDLVADPETAWVVSNPNLNLWYVLTGVQGSNGS